ncbi:MAG: aspartate--tRNA ligase [Planctomycetes bacterium]|nr:aspartate--tRNA ligase [Planctomycetota bacterium]
MPKIRPNRYRTHTCGDLREADVGKTVVLSGWVQTNRDMGGVVFLDLRDRYGLTQVVFDPDRSGQKVHDEAGALRSEWVVRVEGKVRPRPEGTKNAKLPTGGVEVDASSIEVLNKAKTPPFAISDEIDTNEELRLQYRYLDLRRERMRKVLETRSKAAQAARTYFTSQNFVEVETPFMVKYTPGGARNFLVPSRTNKGKFYALAESPQLFKQLLMVAGLDRYFQIVRCFRDEDLRIDRQPEFTQVDVEMSFVEQDDIFATIEGFIAAIWKECLGLELKLPLERIPYEEAERRWGNDKPDRRFGLEHTDLTAAVKEHDGGGLKMLKGTIDSGGIVKGMRVPKDCELPRAQIDKLEEFCKGMGAKGLAWAKIDASGGWGNAPLAKNIQAGLREAINKALGAQDGDTLFFQFGKPTVVHTVMANLRLFLGKKFGMIPEVGSGGKWDFCWVVDPPLFDWNEDEKRWEAAHHAFTRPRDQDLHNIEANPGLVKCWRYDLVLNGFEIAGGSVRNHDPLVQRRIFEAMGIGEKEAQEKFGFLLEAFQYGAPPHGGIAVGWDRLNFLLTETESIRDVVAFPKNQKGIDMMTNAPTPVDDLQLRDLAIKVVLPEEKKAEKAEEKK